MNFGERIDEMIELFTVETKNAEEAALFSMLGSYLDRIFNEGAATDGSPIGKYNDQFSVRYYEANYPDLNAGAKAALKPFEGKTINYKTLRRLAGRQTQYVDLQFSDKLFKSIVVAEVDGRFVLGFTSQDRAIIARDNEKNFGKIIFYPSEQERELAHDVYNDYLRKKVQELFDTW